MESRIYNFFARIFSSLALWLDESFFGKIFNKVSAFFAKAFAGSCLGKFFSKLPDGRALFEGSLFLKLVCLPVFLLKKMAVRVSDKRENASRKSVLFFIADNLELISSKIYGTIFLIFALTNVVLSSIINGFSVINIFVNLGICVLSILLIGLDKSLKSLFKGSSILLSIGGMFYPVKKESSKLFLSDKEIELNVGFISILIGLVAGIFAAILPLKTFIVLFGGVLVMLFTFKCLEFGVFLTVISSPFLPTMALAGLCLLCLLSLVLKIAFDSDFKLKINPLNVFVIFFLAASFFGCINSFSFVSSAKIFFIYFAFIMFYFVITNSITSFKKWKALVVCFACSALIVAGYGVLQNFIGVSSTASWVDEEMFSSIKIRVYSTFDNPNVLGEFLVIMIPTVLALLWGSKKHGHKLLYSLFVGVMCGCMVFTWSRGAWLGVALAVVMFFFIMDKRWTLAGAIGLFFIPLLLGSNSAIVGRLLSIGNTEDTSTAYRVSIWMASVNLIKKFWLSGIGLGSDAFTMIYPKFALAGANFALHSHNLFLQLTVEMGIIGIVSFLALMVAYFKEAYSIVLYKARSRFASIVTIAMASGVLGYMFQGLTDNVWYNYRMMFIFWVIISLTASGYDIVKHKDDLAK